MNIYILSVFVHEREREQEQERKTEKRSEVNKVPDMVSYERRECYFMYIYA